MAAAQRARGLSPFTPSRDVCLELTDHSVTSKSAVDFFQLGRVDPRVAASVAAKLSQQFIAANRRVAALLDVEIRSDYDGRNVRLVLQSGSSVGAIPLISPSSARNDLGLVVQPRFPWAGIGPMLAEMGWRIAPVPLKLPLLRRSERTVPPWVLSTTVLIRLAALLNSLSRKFEMVHEYRSSPRGRVDWDEYVRRSIPAGNLLALPCSFPDLQEDRQIKGAIRYTLQKQIQSLETQKQHGAFVHRLIEFAQNLLQRVGNVALHIPSALSFQMWMLRPMRNDHFLDGLQAIEWTVHDRGLAGMSDLQGLPWRMSMDQFFEAWVETISRSVARRTGAQVKTARQKQTTHAIDWEPSYLGSQKSLLPDIWLQWESTTMIIDAKYKRHWEELNAHGWSRAEDQLREHHRADLFQVLAYANLANTANVIACLAYPCSPETWKALELSQRLIHKAMITVGSRCVHLWLAAVPMTGDPERISTYFSESVRSVVAVQ